LVEVLTNYSTRVDKKQASVENLPF